MQTEGMFIGIHVVLPVCGEIVYILLQFRISLSWRKNLIRNTIKNASEQVARVRACNYVKFETGWNLSPGTHTVHAARCT